MNSKNINNTNNKDNLISEMIAVIVSDYKFMSKYLTNPNDKEVFFNIILRAEKDDKEANTIHINVTIINQNRFIKKYIELLYNSLMANPKMEDLFQHMINKICKDSNRKPEDITAVIDDNAQSHI